MKFWEWECSKLFSKTKRRGILLGFIYCISNYINSKKYIGQTHYSIQKRWQEHKYDSSSNKCANRPLYNAIKKYGIDNFYIEQIEEVSDEKLNEREIYWIEYYDSFNNGYNATKGGSPLNFNFGKANPIPGNLAMKEKYGISINQYDKNTFQYIQTFSTIRDAGKWCEEHNFGSGAASNICKCLKGKIKSAYRIYLKI